MHKWLRYRNYMSNYKLEQGCYQAILLTGPYSRRMDHGAGLALMVNSSKTGPEPSAYAALERALRIFKTFLPEGHLNIRIVQGNLDRVLEEERGKK
jgi:hypothetical protein